MKCTIIFTVLVSSVCAYVPTAVSPTLHLVAKPTTCTSNGKVYQVGESFEPTPCEHCFCDQSGQPICAIMDCFFTQCVDAVHDPKQCCPVCPNGANCRHSDGTIIKKGDTYHPDAQTTCQCPENTFGLHGSLAICLLAPVDVTMSSLEVS